MGQTSKSKMQAGTRVAPRIASSAVVAKMARSVVVACCLWMLLGNLTPAFAGPVINDFSPTSGPVGTKITVNGSGFGTVPSDGITFAGGVVASFVRVSAFQLQVTAPANAADGPITIVNSSGPTTSTQRFTFSAGLTGFTPASGVVGTTVTINGTGLGTTSKVAFNGVNATTINVVSPTQVTAVVPNGATSGPITVTTGAGPVTTGTAFKVLPRVDSFTPTTGAVGTEVIINGKNFTNPNAVLVRFFTTSATFSIVSDTQIKALVPSGASSGVISVTTNEGTSYSSQKFYVATNPTITSFTASATVGSTITINGTNFGGSFSSMPPGNDLMVTFSAFSGSIGATHTGDLDTAKPGIQVRPTTVATNGASLTVVVPFGTTHGPLAITNPAGTGTSNALASPNFILTPRLTSLTPSGANAGDEITINGIGLSAFNAPMVGTSTVVEKPAVTFTTAKAVPESDVTPVTTSAYDRYTQLKVKVPAGVVTGVVTVRTSTSAGGISTGATPIFTPAPIITSFTASAAVGSTITISGTTFGGSADLMVTFSAFDGNISATHTGDLDTAKPGIQVRATTVATNGTSLTVVVPFGATHGPLAVTNPNGTGTSNALASPNFILTPRLTSLTPSGANAGDEITINGIGLSAFNAPMVGTSTVVEKPAVTFSTAKVVPENDVTPVTTSAYDRYTQLKAKVPGGVVAGVVTVRTSTSAGGISTGTTPIFTPAPTITGFTASAAVGSTITISGTNFGGSADLMVTFSAFDESISATHTGDLDTVKPGIQVRPAVVAPNGTSLTVVVPFGATHGPLAVTNPNGTGTSNALVSPNFILTPRLTNFSQPSANVGDEITINGIGLSAFNAPMVGTSTVVEKPTVTFHNAKVVPASDVTPVTTSAYDRYTQLKAKVPTGVVTGVVTVRTSTSSGGISTGTTPIFTAAPIITGIVPQTGPAGTTVVVTGVNIPTVAGTANTAMYGEISGNPVWIGISSGSITLISDTQFKFRVPNHSALAIGPVRLTNASGGVGFSPQHFVPVGKIPTITSFNPVRDADSSVTKITIKGKNFTPQSQVSFNGGTFVSLSTTTDPDTGVVTTDYSVDPDDPTLRIIKVLKPTAATSTGPIRVTNVTSPNPSTSISAPSAVDYAFAPPTITGIVAGTANGPAGSVVTINGTHFTRQAAVLFTGADNTQIPASKIEWVNNTQLRATVPSNVIAGPLTVRTFADTPVWEASTFFAVPGTRPTINSAAAVTNDDPPVAVPGLPATSAALLATNFVINGSNFVPGAQVWFSVAGIAGGNGTSVATATSVNAAGTQLTVTIPANATSGPIRVVTAGGVSALSEQSLSITNQATPTVTLIAPNSAPEGATVTLTGTNFNNNTIVIFAGGATATLNPFNATSGTVVIPNGALTGAVSINNGNTTTAINQARYIKPGDLPTISSFTPTSANMNTAITVTGTNFAQGAVVWFSTAGIPGGNGAANSFATASSVSADGTTLTVTIPNNATVPTSGPIRVVTAAGISALSEQKLSITNQAAPTLTGATPNNAPVGSTIYLIGSNFNNNTVITFNTGDSAPLTPLTSAAGTVVVPAGAVSGVLKINNGNTTTVNGTGSAATFTVATTTPTVTNLPVTTAATNTLNFVVNGTGFANTAPMIWFSVPGVPGGAAGTVATYVSPTELRATIPATAVSGPVRVSIAGVISPLSAQSLTITNPTAPTVTLVSPNSAPENAQVTLTGTGFTNNTVITFAGGATANLSPLSATTGTVIVPPGAQTGALSINNGNVAAGTVANQAIYIKPGDLPTITTFTPTTANTGATLTINGSNFARGAQVWFTTGGIAGGNGTTANTVGTAATVNAAGTQLTVAVPPAATTGPIRVVTATGMSAVSAQTLFIGNSIAPTITGLSPAVGVPGDILNVTGTNFNFNTTIRFSGTSITAQVTPLSATFGTVQVPSGAVTGPLTAVNNGTAGTIAATTPYFVLKGEIPTILNVGGVSPRTAAIGAVAGLTINGTNFTPQSVVWFTATGIPGGNGSVFAPVVNFVSSSEIKVTVPAGATAGPIRVLNAAGPSAQSAEDWASAVPQLVQAVAVTPATGAVGTTITISGARYTTAYGAGFSPYSKVLFTKVGGGTVEGNNFTYNSYEQVKVDVPANAAIGPVYVTNAAGTSAGSVQYFVPFSSTNVIPMPTITSLPSAATIGEEITIAGTNFTPQSVVGFNTLSTSNATANLAATTYFISPTQLRAIVPSTAITGTIYVSNAGGVTESTGTIAITAGVPVVGNAYVGVAAAGPTGTAGSTTLTVTGANFGAAGTSPTVTFTGDVTATGTVTAANTTLTVTVPAGAQTGPITVTTTAGTSQPSPVYFAAAGSTPTVTSLSASQGIPGTIITILGSGFTPQSQVKFGTMGTVQIGTGLNTFINSGELRVVVPVPAGYPATLAAATAAVTVSSTNGTGNVSTFSAPGPNFTVVPIP